jgi:hypothetical protein
MGKPIGASEVGHFLRAENEIDAQRPVRAPTSRLMWRFPSWLFVRRKRRGELTERRSLTP